jgi:hypothetical protein
LPDDYALAVTRTGLFSSISCHERELGERILGIAIEMASSLTRLSALAIVGRLGAGTGYVAPRSTSAWRTSALLGAAF